MSLNKSFKKVTPPRIQIYIYIYIYIGFGIKSLTRVDISQNTNQPGI